MSTKVVRGATIATMNSAFDVIEGDILIRDGRIVALGDAGPEPEGADIIEAAGHVVVPGFVQTHVHLCQTLMRNCADDLVLIDWLRQRIWPYEAALEYDDLRTSARVGLAELMLGGTTTILDMGTVRHTDAIGEAVETSGIRAFIGKCMMDHGEGVPAGLLEKTADSMREALRLADVWTGAGDGRIGWAFAPRFAVSCTEGLLRQVAEAAEDRGDLIHTHAAETAFENEFCGEAYGCTNMQFLERIGMLREGSVLAHGVHVDEAECGVLARTKTAIAHCPSSNLKLASGIANLPRYDACGVRVSLGADGAPCNNNLDAFVEMRLAALIQKPIHGPTAMPARRVLQLATIDGARALGIAAEVGSIEPGKFADLVVLDLDSDPGAGPGGDLYSRVVYSAHRSNVRHVLASGRQLVRNGILLDVDVPALMAEGRDALARVTARM